MKLVKKILIALLGLILILGMSLYIYLYSTKPQYEGELTIKNISKETNVFFDEFGIPHIYACNEKDALTVLGYVHAQERLWQMELLRRIAPGKLSEIFGSKALDNDKMFLALGIDENSEKAIAKLDKNGKSYKLAMAYLDGINQYLENGKTPIEFILLGIEKKPFTLKDVYNTMGYMAFSFACAQRTDPLMTDLRNKLGDNYMKELGVDLSYNMTKIKTNNNAKTETYLAASKAVADILDSSPFPPFIGSNAWIVGGQKTTSGKILFANDPHISYSQPGTWYEAHINSPEQEIYGYYLAGVPFPLLGHNHQYAYGLTMFENDDADFYQEKKNPNNSNQYKTGQHYEEFTTRRKTIKIKDSTTISLNIKESKHGPIMNGILKDFNPKEPVSFYWIYTHEENKILDAIYTLSHSKNLNQFRKGISYIIAPGLNVMYADAQNNFAWQTSGKLYKMNKDLNPNYILNGANGVDDKHEYLGFDKNPRAINPSWNYVYSANNMPHEIEGYQYPGYYLPEDRAKRIVSLLESKNKWSKDDFKKMIYDDTSIVSEKVAHNFCKWLDKTHLKENEKKALSIMQKWKGTNTTSEIAPTIYNKWIYFYLKETFLDEMGELGFKQFLKTHIMKQSIDNQSQLVHSVWWDNIKTKNRKESRTTILTQSFKETIANLSNQLGDDIWQWQWGKVHQVEYKHPIGSVAIFRPFLNVGIFEAPGSNEVINNVMFYYTDAHHYEISAGPSTRRVIDFSDIENSVSILPTGQSGNPMSKHYNDQAQMYIKGQFRKMKMNKEEIQATSTKLLFKTQ
ncbi:Acyl-homoserine lactone acylase QuiP precursor [Flavobacterium columnare]|uniref:Penicillin acylase family protein n=2 Tax=Flavobacterium TaxID=237 RepID=A0ABW8PPA6_9FLAO|nr:penicillin acylase family protein [Flavobacterium columnare]SPE76986.1 Acyl-homoserine lactone acylase QuiP precursor [Flavobacterium columnare]